MTQEGQQQLKQGQVEGALIQEGQPLPLDQLHFQMLGEDNKPQTVSGAEVFKGKTVAVICIPGAFTPVCSSRHVPGYVSKAGALLEAGVQSIVCVSVNDPFVMHAWAQTFPPDNKVTFLADSSLDLAKATGLSTELWSATRLRRFSMLVVDGVVRALNVEPRNENLGVSSADHMLELLRAKPQETVA